MNYPNLKAEPKGSMVKKIALLVVVLLAVLLGFAATKPDTFRVQREISIKAPPEKVFAVINDFHNWGSWSPWEKLDPTMKKTHSGPENGQGSVYEWEGNNDVGKGRMEITETSPAAKIMMKLDFLKPFEAHNFAEFTLEAKGDSTNLTWATYGPNPYFFKLISVFCSMDSMMGKDFETGLSNLKNIVEK